MDGALNRTLEAARDAIEAAIAANDDHCCDAAGRFLLDGLSARLGRLLAALRRDVAQPLGGPFGTAGRWGANGRAPEIADLIRRSAVARLPLPVAEARPPSLGRPTPPAPLAKGSSWPAPPRPSEASSIPRSSRRPDRPPRTHRPAAP